MTASYNSNSLSAEEICLIKGLILRENITQQEIIAHFSHPSRTVSHNLVSQIAQGKRFSDNELFPPAPEAACDYFIAHTKCSWADEFLLSLAAMRPNGLAREHVYSFRYFYHPVGQGVFCSGSFSRPSRQPFRWVYDCGTDGGRHEKRARHVRREIARLVDEQAFEDPPHLDIVTLSHFDEDHLSGLLDLVDTFTIGTLLLPYLTPWQRLEIALIEGVSIGEALLDFLIEPTAFLLERGEGRIERIVIVPAAGEGPALPPSRGPDEPLPEGYGPDRELDLSMKTTHPEAEADGDALGPDGGLSDVRVSELIAGGTITVGQSWEFVPYNDALFAKEADASFRSKAQPLADRLRRHMAVSIRTKALNDLRKLYDKTFKKGAKVTPLERNVISLFLYSGPIGRVMMLDMSDAIPRHRLSSIETAPYRFWERDRFGQLLTGDGYLNTPARWTSFESFFGTGRLVRGGILQVMHHGSAKNWQVGIAAKLQPQASVFCSDPAGRNGHPDWAVLDEFSAYNPKQVDLHHGWSVKGHYRTD